MYIMPWRILTIVAPGAHTAASEEFGIFANDDSMGIQFGDDAPRAGIALETQPRLSPLGSWGVRGTF